MEKIIASIVVIIYLVLFSFGGNYTLKQVHQFSRDLAFNKISQGLGSLERSTRIMTGGKVDF